VCEDQAAARFRRKANRNHLENRTPRFLLLRALSCLIRCNAIGHCTNLNQYQWQSHCRALYQLPVAA
jgi:hypothetical protein